jgi:hypothetical protein
LALGVAWRRVFGFLERAMGPLRRMLGALFGATSLKPEDIVFEPIDVPPRADAARPNPAAAVPEPAILAEASVSKEEPAPGPLVPNRPNRGLPRTVALGDLLPLVPPAWRRSAHYAPEQTIVLPAEARLDMGIERPLAYSLRYLARLHPQWFRDPGPRETDPGVDLWMEPFRDPEASPTEVDVSAELVLEAEEERETFLKWEGEKRSAREVRKEEKETEKALRSVKMPPLLLRVEGEFEDLLRVQPEEAPPLEKTSQNTAANPQPSAPNPRLRKILEAYADGLVGSKPARQTPAQASEQQKSPGRPADAPSKQAVAQAEVSPSISDTVTEPPGGRWGQALSKTGQESSQRTEVPAATGGYQMRFEELGLSLSRFAEVRGFGFWQGDLAQHTGDLGFDARNETAREKLERILDDALSTQGTQDGFLSVTVHHARGAISVFGGGPCLVAVAHHADGLPAHLRSWLCGWVSQPLRG